MEESSAVDAKGISIPALDLTVYCADQRFPLFLISGNVFKAV